MVRRSELTKACYRPRDIAGYLGVTVRTLQVWDKDGRISFQRDPSSDRRYMSRDRVIALLQERGLLLDDVSLKKRDVIYARVSSHGQKKSGDLDRQVQFLIQHCPNLQNVLVLSEVGSGLNDQRKKLQQLLRMVMRGEVHRIFITYRDRLTRFGFHYLETLFQEKEVEIIVVNQKSEKVSVEEELVQDMMSLIASFSGTLYGMRSKKTEVSESLLRDDDFFMYL